MRMNFIRGKWIAALCLCLCALSVGAQGIRFTEGTWDEVLKQAGEKGCPVFVDIYTTWCGPCKKMAREIFTQKEAGDYFNTHFVNCQIDAEKGEGVEIARKFNVSAYPTCLFVDSRGKLISSFLGAQSVDRLLKEGEKAMRNFALLPRLEEMDVLYARGDSAENMAFLLNYCQTRADFGEKGGQPVNDLLWLFADDDLKDRANARWAQAVTVFDGKLLQRMVNVLGTIDKDADKKAFSALDGAIMKSLSTLVQQAIDADLMARFDSLMDFKAQLTALDSSNHANGVIASMGGGIAYVAPEQIKLTFYMKNKHEKEFKDLFLEYVNREMAARPADSLIAQSNVIEKGYADYLASDTVSEEQKEETRRARGMIQLFSGVQNKLLSSSLYNAAEYYWKLSAPQGEELRKQYAEWLRFFYALDRTANMGVPVAEKLVEIGEKTKAVEVLNDLQGFLKLTGDPEKELPRVEEASKRIQS